jgi:hypothetical protein
MVLALWFTKMERTRREAKKIVVTPVIREGLTQLARDHGVDIARMLSLGVSLSEETIADELEKVRRDEQPRFITPIVVSVGIARRWMGMAGRAFVGR